MYSALPSRIDDDLSVAGRFNDFDRATVECPIRVVVIGDQIDQHRLIFKSGCLDHPRPPEDPARRE